VTAMVGQDTVSTVEPDVAMKQQSETGSDLAQLLDGEVVARLTREAQQQGIPIDGENGLLKQLTKMVLETALQGEMDAHLGYRKHEPAGRNSGNSRNGTRIKRVTTSVGPVEVEVPRDRDASFEPKIVAKHQRRLAGVDQLVISLTARGLSSGEICAHLAEVYGTSVSKETISAITDRVLDTMGEWQSRPLDSIYPVLFVDAVYLKIRDGQVTNRPVYVALGVTVDGYSDVLGLWVGDSSGESSKFWLRVLTELKSRGVGDVCMLVCDGLKGLPEVVGQVWPETVVQQCIIHLLRNTFRYASKRDWGEIARDIKPVYTAVSEQAALDAFAEFSDKWEARYPAIIRLWSNAWAEMVPFLRFDPSIRKVVCTTNAIESINARLRRAVNARGHFPNEVAALKCLYLAVRALDPTGKGRSRWSNRWKAALNAFDITFNGRLTSSRL
jgi:putative transposase